MRLSRLTRTGGVHQARHLVFFTDLASPWNPLSLELCIFIPPWPRFGPQPRLGVCHVEMRVTRRKREGAAGLVSNLYSRPSSTLCIHLRPFSDQLHEAVLTCFYTFAPTSSTAVDLPAFRFAHWLLAMFFARVCVLHRAYNHSAHLCIKYGEPRSQT